MRCCPRPLPAGLRADDGAGGAARTVRRGQRSAAPTAPRTHTAQPRRMEAQRRTPPSTIGYCVLLVRSGCRGSRLFDRDQLHAHGGRGPVPRGIQRGALPAFQTPGRPRLHLDAATKLLLQ